MANTEQELRDIASKQLQDPVIIIGYLEHQMDLIGKIVQDLSKLVDTTNAPPDVKVRLGMLDTMLTQSSVDFNNLNNPLQSYKIPNCVGIKAYTRRVQEQYLNAKLREGLF